MNFLQTTLANIGHAKVAKACGVSRQAVRMWGFFKKLPDTEHLTKDHPRRTEYAAEIARLGKCRRSQLLEQV